MAKVTFDGVNKRIDVITGTVSINVESELYSAWKSWCLLGNNLKYEHAFRTFGGDQTVPGQLAPKYFFLTNGWRVYVDGDGIVVASNLYTDEGDSAFVLTNNASVSLSNSDVPVVDQKAIQYASYNGGVTLDVTSSYTGVTYPVGNTQSPVNNMQDALLICKDRGFDTINIVGDYTLTTGDNVDGYILVGSGATKTTIIIEDGSSTIETEFFEATIAGIFDGGCVARECMIGPVTYMFGYIVSSITLGPIYTSNNSEKLHIIDSNSGGGTLQLDCGGDGPDIAINNHNGKISLTNKTGNSYVSIDANSTEVFTDSTITTGDVIFNGVGFNTDSGATANIINNFLSSANITDAIWNAGTRELTSVSTPSLTTEQNEALLNAEAWAKKAGSQRLN